MKKILSMIALTVLMVALAGSCTKNLEERLDKTDADVATLKAAIGQYEKLQSDITTVLQALRAEVGTRPASEQQSVWNCINALQSQSNAFDAALKALQKLVGETSVDEQISEAVENLVNAYNLDELASTLKSLEEEVARKFDVQSLEKQINQLSKTVREIDYYLARINAFYGLVQSVAILPKYDDGSIKAGEEGLVEFKCVVTPAAALAGISGSDLAKCFTLTLATTGANAGKSAEITVTSAEVADSENGIVKITADISDYIPEDGSRLMLALNLKLGASNLTSGFTKVYATPTLPAGALPGEFSVSADKKVHFSQGNLVATIDATGAPTAWKFSANQYDYLGEGGANKTIGATAGDVDLFGWSTSNNGGTSTTDNYGIKTSTFNSAYSGDFYDWGKAVGDGNTWRTLSKDEWTYLFNTRTVNGGKGAGKSYSLNITYGGKMGVVLYPDDYTGSVLSGTVDSLPEGVVFLPVAGSRGGSGVSTVGDCGYCWSSTDFNSDFTYCVYFSSSTVTPDSFDYRYAGFCVRLVTEVK